MTKQVKIIGLSVNKNFGGLKATELKFDPKNRLTVIKGEVGAGKTTLNRAMRLTTQGSNTLTDKHLYGDIDIVNQLVDGDKNIFVGCRTDKNDNLVYFLYSVDENGKKINNVVIDGKKATPANYLKSLQTALTWRLDELTSENPTTQRNILLELYEKELEKKGVIFDKSHSKYEKGIIAKIEKAKNQRSYLDMKRKEVGGIADDLNKKGIDTSERKELKDKDEYQKKVNKIQSEIEYAETNFEEKKKSKLNSIKLKITNIVSDVKDLNQKRIDENNLVDKKISNLTDIRTLLFEIVSEERLESLMTNIKKGVGKIGGKKKVVEFDGKKIKSKPKDFDGELGDLIKQYKELKKKYKKVSKEELDDDNSKLNEQLEQAKKELEKAVTYNKEAEAVNALMDWREANDTVNEIKKDYYLKLTEIDTGVKGLKICTDPSLENEDNIYLMYDGSYDKKYFNNPKKELRKISSYSGTQKPMICLLIQNYLLSKKEKSLPYLWIDDVPIDKKTRSLLEKMAEELDLWLFVNWTGDFKSSKLNDGEMLLENGEILVRE